MSIEGLLLLEEWHASRRLEISEHKIKSTIKYKALEGGGKSVLQLNSYEHLIEVEIRDNAEISYSTIELNSNQVLESKTMEFTEQDDFHHFLDSMLYRYLYTFHIESPNP